MNVDGLHKVGERLYHWRRRLASAVLVAFAGILFAHVLLGSNGWMAYRKKKAEYERLLQDKKRIEEENQRLDSEIKSLRSDPKAIEKEAREQLRYAKPGEVIVLYPDQPAQAPSKDQAAKK
jgi:cell division protein FtsB